MTFPIGLLGLVYSWWILPGEDRRCDLPEWAGMAGVTIFNC